MIKTYQDFALLTSPSQYEELISEYRATVFFRTAVDAELYDKQQNTFISNFAKNIYTITGQSLKDPTASNHRIASNFFNKLNTQRNTYVLGNGVEFKEQSTKKKLGKDFESTLKKAGYNALIHGITYLFWNNDRMYNFKATEFLPFFDEDNGKLRAGIRFWQIDIDKPLIFTIYEESGYTKYRSYKGSVAKIQEKTAYKIVKTETQLGEILDEIGENYDKFPIIPMYGNRTHQSTLVGMKEAIDSYDLIISGFANDNADIQQCYWIINGAQGMKKEDLAEFRQRLLFNKIATANVDDGTNIEAKSIDIPVEARTKFLELIRAQIYDDFCALDTAALAGGEKTATAIQAMYEPMNSKADDYEYQISDAMQNVFELAGIDDTIIFKRSAIINQTEITSMVLSASEYLDDETILKKLPFITTDEVTDILNKKEKEESERSELNGQSEDSNTETTDEGGEPNKQTVQPDESGN